MVGLPKKKRKAQASSVAVLIVMGLLLSGVYGNEPEEAVPEVDTCTDGIDNDSDGLADFLDPECDPASPSSDGVEDGDA